MSRLLRATALLAAVAMAAASAATADGNAMKMTLHSPVSVASGDTSSCPTGYLWVGTLHDDGPGTMVSTAYSGDVTFTADHCTRILVNQRAGTPDAIAVGKIVGTQTVVTPEGILHFDFQGTFVLKGAFPMGDFTTDGTMSWTVTGGTGVFAGAAGHGAGDIHQEPLSGLTLEMNGALQLND